MSVEFPGLEADLKKQVDHFKAELSKIRSGRVSPQILEDILIEHYGTRSPLKGLATITALDPQTLIVEPWDQGSIEPIAGAISRSALGVQAIPSERVIRVPFPPLSEDRRKELIKFVNQKSEETKVQLRRARDSEMKALQQAEKDGTISKDEQFRSKEKLEKIFKDHAEQIETIKAQKEQELIKV